MNWNILVAGGEESKRDSPSSGERKGNSLNQFSNWGRGKTNNEMIFLWDEAAESCTKDGESPVVKKETTHLFIPSSMGHVKSRVNQRGPPRKAKYS